MSSVINQLITTLRRVRPEADAEDVADWLWLAAYTSNGKVFGF